MGRASAPPMLLCFVLGLPRLDRITTIAKWLSTMACLSLSLCFPWHALTRSLSFHLYILSGLRYEDILSRDEPEVNEALELAHPDVVEGRYRRLKRASDLAFKQKNLHDYAPDILLDPFKEEITSDVQKILSRDIEYDLLNNHKKG